MNKGLYTPDYEHDACGVGMVVNIHGNKSHELVDSALHVLENMRHRGAEIGKDGDGAGIMVQIPHEFILLQGIPVPEKGKYGTGLVFLPKDEQARQTLLSMMIEEIEREGLQLMHLRTVPTNPECLGDRARDSEPDIKQVFVTENQPLAVPAHGAASYEQASLELMLARKLYIVRKKIERRVHQLVSQQNNDAPNPFASFYICSLSNTNIVYKGMLSSMQVRQYYPDLTNPYFTSGLGQCPRWKCVCAES